MSTGSVRNHQYQIQEGVSALSDGLLTVGAAVEFTGLPRTTVYALIQQGEVPSLKVGRRRLVPKRALVDYLAKQLDSPDAA